MAKVTEGYMPFLGFETYYRVVGERKDNGKHRSSVCTVDLVQHTTTTRF